MAKSKVVVRLNSAGMGALLKSEAVGAHIEGIARSRAGGQEVSRIVGRSRQNIRIHGDLHGDAQTGSLTRTLGG